MKNDGRLERTPDQPSFMAYCRCLEDGVWVNSNLLTRNFCDNTFGAFGELKMDKCDECGKRIAKDLQICRACYKKFINKYKATRELLAEKALDELKEK